MRRVILFLCILLLALTYSAQTVNNNILLFVTKANQWDAHLEWANIVVPPPPYVYKIYKSPDPTVLGIKIANVNGDINGGTYDDIGALNDNFTYYYQVLRTND
jgi:hypothetical protein